DSFDVAGGAIYLGGHDGHGHHDHHGGAMSPHVHEEEPGQKAKGEEHHQAVEEGHEHAVPSGLSEHHRQEKFGGPARSLSGSPSPGKSGFGNAVDAVFARGELGGPAVSLSGNRSPVKFGFGNVVDALFASEEEDSPGAAEIGWHARGRGPARTTGLRKAARP